MMLSAKVVILVKVKVFITETKDEIFIFKQIVLQNVRL